MVDVRVGIIGLGSVGQGVVKILSDNISLIQKKTNAKISIIGVSGKNKKKQREVQINRYQWFDNPISLAVNEDADIIIELIGGEDGIALEVVESALKAGKNVITANKALIAKNGNYLLELAEKNGAKLLFEAAIAGSIPIVKTLKESVASNTISAIYGILNGTCNYILTSMEKEGISFVPRPRDDFEKIYIIADFDQSKNFIPSLRFNYILDKEIYVSSQSVTRIDDRKKLLDFSKVILTVPNSFLKEDKSINPDELSKLSFLQDLILISAIKKNNGNSQIIAGQFANIRFSQNTCSDMQTNLVQIDNLGQFSQL